MGHLISYCFSVEKLFTSGELDQMYNFPDLFIEIEEIPFFSPEFDAQTQDLNIFFPPIKIQQVSNLNCQ